MTYQIRWSRRALAAFYHLHPWTAMTVDRAVIRFVERGEGVVEHEPPYVRLRAGFYDVLPDIDHEQRVVGVMQFYRARAR
jgi:mRNA-degrading endonuclease RelE of RelBE toxin-antitoxin system